MATLRSRNAGAAPTLNRSNTTKSTSSTTNSISVHKPRSTEYWNDLICLFTGLGTNPTARGATSLNNKDIFPSSGQLRSTSPSPVSQQSNTAPKRSGSFMRPSLSKRRTPSRSSLFSRKGRTSSDTAASPLGAVPEGSIMPSESQMRADANAEILSRIGSNGSEVASSYASASTSFGDNMIPIIKDGQTLWLPESVVAQYLGGIQRLPSPTSPQFTVPRRSSLRGGHRPGMRISIPAQHSLPRPEDVCDAVPVRNRPARPVHPLERRSYESSNDGSSPPGLASDRSSAYSPDMQSQLSDYQDGTSQSSLSEAQTPQNGSPVSSRSFTVIDPAVEGVFDEGHLLPGSKDFAIGQVMTPTLPTSPASLIAPPALPQRSRKRLTCESALEPPSYADVPLHSPSDAKSINEMSLVLSQDTSQELKNEASISNEAAEAVILSVLSSIDNIEDLFHCAIINKGFYSVYKCHESDLIKNVFALANPAAAEAREQ